MRSSRIAAVVIGGMLLGSLGLSPTIDSTFAASVLRVPKDFATIQAAVDAANAGDIIHVKAGTYNENVLVTTPDISLHGIHATLNGTGLGGNGFHVLNASEVVIMGFVVENFQNGVVLENADNARVHLNELRNNVSDPMGLLTRNGILLDNAHWNRITNNYIRDNGHNGITLINASSNNTIRANISVNNGTQVAAFFGGCGLQTGGPNNNNNIIIANEFLGGEGVQGWGIQIGVGGNSSGNTIRANRSHENNRAGIAMFAPASGNLIQANNAKGNGLANLAPSGTFDLWDQDGAATDNTWKNNQGVSNF